MPVTELPPVTLVGTETEVRDGPVAGHWAFAVLLASTISSVPRTSTCLFVADLTVNFGLGLNVSPDCDASVWPLLVLNRRAERKFPLPCSMIPKTSPHGLNDQSAEIASVVSLLTIWPSSRFTSVHSTLDCPLVLPWKNVRSSGLKPQAATPKASPGGRV